MDVECQAVRERGFELLGLRGIDLSAEGLSVDSDVAVEKDESVIVSIRLPGRRKWIDAEATVTAVEAPATPSARRRLALRFRYVDPDAEPALLDALVDELVGQAT